MHLSCVTVEIPEPSQHTADFLYDEHKQNPDSQVAIPGNKATEDSMAQSFTEHSSNSDPAADVSSQLQSNVGVEVSMEQSVLSQPASEVSNEDNVASACSDISIKHSIHSCSSVEVLKKQVLISRQPVSDVRLEHACQEGMLKS